MVSMSQIVTDVFSLAIGQAFPEVQDAAILIQKGKFADYQCNSAMNICQVKNLFLAHLSKGYLSDYCGSMIHLSFIYNSFIFSEKKDWAKFDENLPKCSFHMSNFPCSSGFIPFHN